MSFMMCKNFSVPMTVHQHMQAVLYGVLALLQLLFMHWKPDLYQHLRFKVRGSNLVYYRVSGH
jgi:hypothetical protein